MIDFVHLTPRAEITAQDVHTVRSMNPGQTNIEELPPEDWPEWARIDLQTIANHRHFWLNITPRP